MACRLNEWSFRTSFCTSQNFTFKSLLLLSLLIRAKTYQPTNNIPVKLGRLWQCDRAAYLACTVTRVLTLKGDKCWLGKPDVSIGLAAIQENHDKLALHGMCEPVFCNPNAARSRLLNRCARWNGYEVLSTYKIELPYASIYCSIFE